MAALRTPFGLPLPLAKNFSGSIEESRSRIEMYRGFARTRNLYRQAPRLFDLQWDLTANEYKAFDTWYQFDIRGGALEFDTQLISGDQVVWYTCRFVGPYSSELLEDYSWRVKATVRTTKASFVDRPSGTDELQGISSPSINALGGLLVEKILRGVTDVGVVGSVRLALRPDSAVAEIEVVSTAQFAPRPFWGSAEVGVEATVQLGALGEDKVELIFDAVVYTPPLGDSVTLQFDNVVYIPPLVNFGA